MEQSKRLVIHLLVSDRDTEYRSVFQIGKGLGLDDRRMKIIRHDNT